MAIIATANFGENVVLPSGYTNPTLPPISSPAVEFNYQVDIAATVANTNPVVGASNLISALESEFQATHAISVLKLDATAAVTAALTITSYIRLNDGDDVSGFKAGTEVYRCNVSYSYE